MSTKLTCDELDKEPSPGSDQRTDILPPLENGDRLTRSEFERRYDAMPHLKKAELIEGMVRMPSPVRVRSHGKPHGQIMGWLSVYSSATPGVEFADNTTVRLDPDNEVQPDAVLWLSEAADGGARITEDDYLEGSPELIVEISSSSVSYDLHDKLKVYRRNGVKEYVVWRVYDRQIDWFRLEAEEYLAIPADADLVSRSKVFPGLWLNVPALLSGDLPCVFSTLEKGLGSVEHADFVVRLEAPVRKE
jgi:Uma2 family endonuclease